MKDITFGQYYPVDSVIHRLDPRIKIILCIACRAPLSRKKLRRAYTDIPVPHNRYCSFEGRVTLYFKQFEGAAFSYSFYIRAQFVFP